MLVNNISKTPQQIVDENNWSLVTDNAVLEETCLRVLANNEKAVCCIRLYFSLKLVQPIIQSTNSTLLNTDDLHKSVII